MNTRSVQQKVQAVAQLLGAMGNEHRLRILCELTRGERRVSDLAPTVGLSQSALSQHLAKLKRAGIVRARRASRAIFYSLTSEAAERVILAVGRSLIGATGPPCGDAVKQEQDASADPVSPITRRADHVD